MRTVVSACLATTSVCPERPVQSDTSLVEYEYIRMLRSAPQLVRGRLVCIVVVTILILVHGFCVPWRSSPGAVLYADARLRVDLGECYCVWSVCCMLVYRMMNYSIIIIILNIRTRG